MKLELWVDYSLSISGGLAYLEAKDGQKAGIEFQKIVDHPGLVLNSPIGPPARLQIRRAYLM
jgi:hypothetical protein